MTGLIAIDESGDTGTNGSRFFLIAAVVTKRSRNLLKAYKSTPTHNRIEIKFYNSTHRERSRVLNEIAMADVQIVYACIDKKKLNEPYRNGNELYHQVLKEVIRRSMEVSQETDIDVVIDGSGFIKSEELMEIGKEISVSLEKNLKRCSKVSFNKCVRLADYIAGSLWAKYERENNEYFEMIKERISVACESLRPR